MEPASVGYITRVNDEQVVKAAADVVSRVVDGEAVLLDLASGKYFGLNEVGSRVWEHTQEGIAVSALFQRLQGEFEVDPSTLRADLDELLAELAAKKLITVT